MSYIGRKVQLTLFGESHGKGVGALLTGLPPGHIIDPEVVEKDLAARKPGAYGTPRREPDPWEILSGVYGGKTTGTPLAIWIPNLEQRPEEYRDLPFRPGHADYTAHIKYKGAEDPRGGGHFSGRLTAPLVAAGAICKSILRPLDIRIAAKVTEVGGETDPARIREALHRSKTEGDSLGGLVDVRIQGVPAGIGGPRFQGLESALSAAYFGIGAVKGVAFGAGFASARMRGSAHNDPFVLRDGRITAATNHAGGVLGGIATGADIEATVAVKPTPTIRTPQPTVDRAGNPTTYTGAGRHDTAVVLRIPVVLEAVSAVVILDELAQARGEL